MRARGGLPAEASPSESAALFSHRKFRAEAAAPSRNPAAARHPQKTNAAATPAMVNTAMHRTIRAIARSGSIAAIPVQFADQLDQSGDGAQSREDPRNKIGAESF